MDGSRGGKQRDARELPSALEVQAELAKLMEAKQPAVFLDYDGTLTPIVSQPEDALLSDEMRAVLKRLADVCPVAIVSGRDRADVQPLVGLDGLVYAGSHGFDIQGPGGLRMEHDGGRQCLADLDQAEAELRPRVEAVPGARLERKRFAIATHYRNVADADVPQVEAAVREVIDHFERLRMSGGKKIFEFRPDIDWDKGKAMFWLLEALGLDHDGVIPLYIGDDVTDEDAFRALQGRGIGVVVGAPAYPTYASYALKDTPAVQEFIEKLVRQLGDAKS